MPRWDPSPIWKGEDAYVIGGGPSLESFDWDLIKDSNTIGCNSAFVLGSDYLDIVIFGDQVWWDKIGKERTAEFGGLVVGCTPKLVNDTTPWLLKMERHEVCEFGLDSLVWGGNTGCMAINLALILGAHRVFLLGFDMKLGSDGKANWHEPLINRYESNRPEPYIGFINEFKRALRNFGVIYPGREVWNVTDDSALDVFRKVSLKEHFSNKGQK